MSHTPGPWKVQRDFGLRQRIQQANDSGTLAYMTSRPFAHGGNFSHDQITDNARLIAAAPDLLEALRMVLAIMCDKAMCGHFLPEEIREVVEPAIAKAAAK